MFTTNPKTITFTANYEGDPNNADDEPLFEDVQVAAIKDFNHTTGDPNYTNAQVLRSSPHNQVGSAIAIPVGQGDKITAIAFAKYIAAAQDPNVSSVTIASALVSAFTGVASSGIEGGTGTINNNFSSGSLIGGTGFPLESGTAPRAFLNLMFLPDGDPINLVKDASFAYDQVADGATEAVIDGVSNSPFDELRIDNFVAPGQGYVMVYVSNEGSLTDVYFDDIEITVEEHPVIEKTDYYPGGLTFNSYNRVTAKKNDYLYQGKEWQGGLDLDTYDFHARMYDPALVRTFQQDPMSEMFYTLSPYSWAANNPISFVDPTGMVIEEGSQKEWEKQKGYVQNRRNNLQGRIDKLNAKAADKGWSAEKLANKTGNLADRVASLDGTLETLGTLESSEQVYSLSQAAPGDNGGVTLNTETDAIDISFGTTSNFVHEATHAVLLILTRVQL